MTQPLIPPPPPPLHPLLLQDSVSLAWALVEHDGDVSFSTWRCFSQVHIPISNARKIVENGVFFFDVILSE